MRDAQTGSQWLHYTGECIEGPLRGRSLAIHPTNTLDWGAFRQRRPDASVIANTPSLLRRLLGYFDGQREAPSFMRLPGWFTRTMHRSPGAGALPEMELGLGVVVGQRDVLGGARASGARFYPYKLLRAQALVQHALGGADVLVLWDDEGASGSAFQATLAGRTRRFERDAAGAITDDAGNRYDPDGRVLAGPDAGARLTRLPAIATRWYGFHQTYPDAEVFAPGGARAAARSASRAS